MQIKSFTTDAEGVKRWIDFLHGSENLIHIKADNPSVKEVFYLERASAVLPPATSSELRVVQYEIDIATNFVPTEKELSKLLDLLKETYKS